VPDRFDGHVVLKRNRANDRRIPVVGFNGTVYRRRIAAVGRHVGWLLVGRALLGSAVKNLKTTGHVLAGVPRWPLGCIDVRERAENKLRVFSISAWKSSDNALAPFAVTLAVNVLFFLILTL
jgi:hypothetical protein